MSDKPVQPASQLQEKRPAKVTIIDVARAANVGRSTVSRVINNSPSVDNETRSKILQVMKELQYVPQASARANRLSRSNAVGYVFGLPQEQMNQDPFHASVFQGAAEACSEAGLNILYFRDNTRVDPYSISGVIEAARGGAIDGVIAILAHDSHLLQALEEWKVPTILIDPQHPGPPFPWVAIDNIGAMEQTVRTLQDCGHRRIAFIAGEYDDGMPLSFRERMEGYRNVMEGSDNWVEDLLVIERMEEGLPGVTAGYRGANKILELNERPTAIATANDLIAFGVMKLLYERNIRIPDQISVVGFDNVPTAMYTAPALSTVNVPKELLGRKAVECFLEGIEEGSGVFLKADCLHRVQAALVNRESIAILK